MLDIRQQHAPHLLHHVEQGLAWLKASENGKHTAAISYSALEFRFAIERLAVHYWAILLGRRPTHVDMRTIESFKSLERAIYDLAGHQAQINGHFAFMRVMLDAICVQIPLQAPSIGLLSKHWHTCSEMCHISWVLGSAFDEVQAKSSQALAEVGALLTEYVRTASSWPAITHAPLHDLRDKFVRGEVSEHDVRETLARDGMWASLEHPDGRREFVGKAVPPSVAIRKN